MTGESAILAPSRSRWILAALALAAVLYLFANASRERAIDLRLDAAGRNAALVASSEDRTSPLANLGELREQLVRAPIDQGMLNHFLAAQKGDGGWEDEEVSQLASLGYRSSVAQLNLLTLAAQREDWAAAVRHTDALLRRRRASNEVRAIMFLAESTPEGREQLVQSMKDWPDWAAPYFVDSRFTQIEGGVDARLDLFAIADREELRLPRDAAARSSSHMARAGAYDAAHDLFVRYEEGNGLGVTDTSFARLADFSDRDEQPFPFDWALSDNRDARARVSSPAEENSVSIRWDGRGNPKFLEKVVRLEGPAPAIHFQMPISDLQSAARILRLEWQCLTGADTRASIERGRANAADSELVFAAPILAECTYAKFTLKGLSSGMDSRHSLKINGVRAL